MVWFIKLWHLFFIHSIYVYSYLATCIDGLKNQEETEIDCGGPCDPCPPPPGRVLKTKNETF